MALLPTQFDFHLAATLSRYLRGHPLFDHCVDSAIDHHLLGGIPFACGIFYFWVRAERENHREILVRLVSILLGSLVTIALLLMAGKMNSWLPPRHQPVLSHLYPSYLEPDANSNSFPSDSTGVFTSIAVGILSISETAGLALLAAVPVFVSLPRMYVGGHFLSDVIAGFLLGVTGYAIARYGLESWFSTRILAIGSRPGWRRTSFETCIFLWILEVAVNFREGVWIVHTLRYFHGKLF